MSFGQAVGMGDFGSADAWGGSPMDGVDVVDHIMGGTLSNKLHRRLSTDAYTAIIIVLAIGGLWLLGGVAFKSANIG